MIIKKIVGALPWVVMCVICTTTQARDKSNTTKHISLHNRSIYGNDDRTEIDQNSPPWIQLSAFSVAMQLPQKNYHCSNESNFCELKNQTLVERLRLCPNSQFAQEISVGECTGFLVGPKLLMTAGHCVRNHFMCKALDWVFNYTQKNSQINSSLGSVPKNSIYQCARVLKLQIDGGDGVDLALVELDRQVSDAILFSLEDTNPMSQNSDYWALGHPYGLPMKLATKGTFIKEEGSILSLRLDTFQGSSGSPVLDPKTQKVVGLIVRGQEDHHWDEKLQCFKLNYYADDDAKGEQVVGVSELHKLMQGI